MPSGYFIDSARYTFSGDAIEGELLTGFARLARVAGTLIAYLTREPRLEMFTLLMERILVSLERILHGTMIGRAHSSYAIGGR